MPTRALCYTCYINKRKLTRRADTLRQRYGITEEYYGKLFSRQNGCCAICKNPETSKHQNGKIKNLAVDHLDMDDGSKLIRGLLCKSCNQAIGLLKENPTIALNAAAYVALRGNP